MSENLPTGRHAIADFSGVEASRLNSPKFLKDALVGAIDASGATLLNVITESFSPQGVTVVAVLAESHATIHTYPECGVAMVDAFSCGEVSPVPIIETLIASLEPSSHNLSIIDRGEVSCHNGGFISEPIGIGLERRWRINRIIHTKKTKFQNLVIAETDQGRSLFCDNERQSTEFSQLLYHEGQIIPAALVVENIENILVIGSSEGVVSQIAVALGAKNVVHVDIDRECVEACAKYLPYGYSEYDLSSFESEENEIKILFEDGIKFIESISQRGNRKFDIVVLDLPDESSQDEKQQNRAYEKEFLEKIKMILHEGGAMICQAGCSTLWRNTTLKRLWARVGEVYPSRVFFELSEQDWCWVIGCKNEIQVTPHEMSERLKTLQYQPVHIDAVTIAAATIPPISLRRNETI